MNKNIIVKFNKKTKQLEFKGITKEEYEKNIKPKPVTEKVASWKRGHEVEWEN